MLWGGGGGGLYMYSLSKAHKYIKLQAPKGGRVLSDTTETRALQQFNVAMAITSSVYSKSHLKCPVETR